MNVLISVLACCLLMAAVIPQIDPKYLPVKGAAARSGCSENLIRRWIDAGTLTPYRPTPDKILVSVEELDSLIESTANAPGGSRGAHLRKS